MNMVLIAFFHERGTRRNCFAAVTPTSSLFAYTHIENLTKVWDKTQTLIPIECTVFAEHLKKDESVPFFVKALLYQFAFFIFFHAYTIVCIAFSVTRFVYYC